MKSRFLSNFLPVLICMVLISVNLFAQPQIRWQKSYPAASGTGTDEVTVSATDASGNIYVAGNRFNGTGNDIQLIKYSPSGAVLAQSNITTNGLEEDVTAIAVDASGNVYIGGNVVNTTTFDQYAFLAKLNPATNFSPQGGFIDPPPAPGVNYQYRVYGTPATPGGNYQDEVHQIVVNGTNVDLLSTQNDAFGTNLIINRVSATNGISSAVSTISGGMQITPRILGVDPFGAPAKLAQSPTHYYVGASFDDGDGDPDIYIYRVVKSTLAVDLQAEIDGVGSEGDYLYALQRDAGGNIYAALSYSRALGNRNLMVSKYNSTLTQTGNYEGLQPFNASDNEAAYALAFDAGAVYVVGAEAVNSGTISMSYTSLSLDLNTINWSGKVAQVENPAGPGSAGAGLFATVFNGRLYAGGTVFVDFGTYISNSQDMVVDVVSTATGNPVSIDNWVVVKNGLANGYDDIAGMFVDGTGRVTIAGTTLNTDYDFFAAQYCFPSDITINSTPSTPICPGSSVNLSAVSVLGQISTYAWSPSSGLNSTTVANVIATPTAVPLVPAASVNADYFVTITNVMGCTSTAQSTIVIDPRPKTPVLVTDQPSNAACQGTTFSLIDNNGYVAGNTYNWVGTNGDIIANITPNDQPVTPTLTTTYGVTVTNINGCSAVSSIVTTVNPIPVTPTVASTDGYTFCGAVNTTLTADGSPGDSYNWSPSTGLNTNVGNTVVATPTTNVTYTVVVANVTGCTNSATVAITLNALPSTPTLTSSPTYDLMDNQYVCNSANSNYTVVHGIASPDFQWYLDNSPIPGANLATLVNQTQAGNYSVVVTDLNTGCTGNALTTNGGVYVKRINETVLIPQIAATTPTNFCVGGSASFAATGTLPNYQWLVGSSPQVGETAPTYTYNGASANITLQSVNACGTFTSNTIAVTRFAAAATPVLSGANPINVCPGSTATIAVTNNTFSAYTWTATTNNFTSGINSYQISAAPTSTTTYTVVATNSNGCTSSAQKVVDPFTAAPQPNLISDKASPVCAGTSVTFTTNASSFSYQWLKNGAAIASATAPTYVANTTGTYSVQITDGNGCTNTSVTFPLSVESPLTAATVIAGGPTSFCEGGTVTLTSSTLPNYQWYIDGVAIPTATFATYVADTTGSFTVHGSNVCGLSPVSNAISVISNPPLATPTIVAGGRVSLCTGETVTLNVANPQAGVNYQWRLGSSPIAGATGLSYVVNATGQYTVQAANTLCGAKLSNSIGVIVSSTVPATPPGYITPTGSNTFTICQGSTAVIAVPGEFGVTYNWYQDGAPISNANSPTLTVSQTGFYKLILTNGCGATQMQSPDVFVSVSSLPNDVVLSPDNGGSNAISDPDTTVCKGAPFKATALPIQAGVTYQWYRNSTPTFANFYESGQITESGNYTLKITLNSSGCFRYATDTLYVRVLEKPDPVILAYAPDTTVCVDENVALSIPRQPGATYQWIKNGSNLFNDTSNTKIITSSVPDRSIYILQVSNQCGATTSRPQAIEFVGKPIVGSISIDGTPTWCGPMRKLSINPTPADVYYQWYNNTPNPSPLPVSAGGTSPFINVTGSGTWTVQVRSKVGTCVSDMSAPLVTRLLASPLKDSIINTANDTFCNGSSVLLKLKTVQPDVSLIQWYQDGNVITGATGSTYVATEGGVYSVKQSNQCRPGGVDMINTVKLTRVDPPIARVISFVGDTTICSGGSIELSIPASAGAVYTWYRGNVVVIANGTTPSYTATTSGVYRVETKNLCGTAQSINDVNVTVVPALSTPTIRINGKTVSPVTVCAGSTLKIDASQMPGTYNWYRGSFLVESGTNLYTLNNVDVAGVYTVQITNGYCTVTSNAIEVKVDQAPVPFIITSNLPSPQCATGVSPNVTLVLTSTPSQTGVVSYDWKKNGVSVGAGPSLNVSSYSPASYTLTISNSCGTRNGLSAFDAVINKSPEKPTFSAGSYSVCTGGSPAQAQVLCVDQFDKVTWEINGVLNGTRNLNPPTTIANFNVGVAGQLTATVFANGCASPESDPVTVVSIPSGVKPVLTVSDGSATFCAGSGGYARVAISNFTSPMNYTWSSIGAPNAQSIMVFTNGTFVVTATNACGTYISAPIVITEYPRPANPNVSQVDKSLIITNINSGTYSWYGPADANGIGPLVHTGQTYNPSARGIYTVVFKDQFGCEATVTGILYVPAGLPEDQALAQALTVFPNPNNGIFNIELDLNYATEVDMIVRDLRGVEVYKTGFSSSGHQMSRSIDITDLAAGVYTLEVKTDRASKVIRLVKNN